MVHPFDAPEDPYGPGHRGIDVAVPGGGTPVRAVEAGTVRFSGSVAGRGVVSVLHADGLISTYEPVAGTLAEGTKVRAGEMLGVVAESEASHCSGRMCLHLGARRGQGYLDPEVLLGARGPSVLLPWSSDGRATARGAVAGRTVTEERATTEGRAVAEETEARSDSLSHPPVSRPPPRIPPRSTDRAATTGAGAGVRIALAR
ncbi:hypothetical protein BH708_18825 [Brachybacterium sp. P6-10-X1]|uniref:murein hydrolase activator EnvC family protein n=1 Tax=Brachybacterium sp. P6-10-X1 TaxID=1903186 RepID=UPI00097198B2|nr:M23 family metallopeptidase [Brachybacterium sp. P6-10-X1]APX34420.1 hypothetical protein BH708_18825 [Brachybacterium sp. P6-10-X1]